MKFVSKTVVRKLRHICLVYIIIKSLIQLQFVHWEFVVSIWGDCCHWALLHYTHFTYDDFLSFSRMAEFNGNAVLVLSRKVSLPQRKKKFLHFICIIISNTLGEIMDIFVCMCIGACLLLYIRLVSLSTNRTIQACFRRSLLRFKKRELWIWNAVGNLL